MKFIIINPDVGREYYSLGRYGDFWEADIDQLADWISKRLKLNINKRTLSMNGEWIDFESSSEGDWLQVNHMEMDDVEIASNSKALLEKIKVILEE